MAKGEKQKRIGQPAGEMSFLDHLEQLRWHMIRAIIATALIAIVIFLAKDLIFDVIIFGPKKPTFVTYEFFCGLSDRFCFSPPDFDVITRKLEERFVTHIKVSIILGIIVAFPYIFWEIWRFVKPGLYKEEQRATRGVVFISSFLFLSGIAFGYFVISPFAITFLAGYDVSDTLATVTLGDFVSLMTMFTFPAGLIFELPIVVYFLSKIGLLTPEFMKKYRRHSFIIILILAAVITPPDVITQFLIGLPLYFLYEISIIISRRVNKNLEAQSL